jgi:mannose-6-phosphate isomerase-like protein (cupin superfamily)
VFLFTDGQGIANIAGFSLGIHEIALLAPVHHSPLSITATSTVLEVLEMIIILSAEDLRELEACHAKFPFFISYSDCKTYRERIKSPKTVSRTLLPEHTFPRLCVGSVETTGPDHVAAHKHPMLEQLFFGLPGNRCTVHADGRSAEFGENVLLHIPLGSDHSVDVAAPNRLHYIWIDLFRDKSGMDWITREHITDE